MKFFKCALLLIFLVGCNKFTLPHNSPMSIFTSTTNPPHVLYAARYVGLQERQNRAQLRSLVGVDPVRIEWCAAFVNAILERHGIPGSDSVSDTPLMARSFLDWGEPTDEPKRGDIVIFRRGNSSWQGHVAIYLGTVERNGRTYYRTLGGNQNDSVNVSEYPASALLGIRRISNPLQRVQRIALN